MLLIDHLCLAVNPREPAAITWMRVVPAYNVLMPPDSLHSKVKEIVIVWRRVGTAWRYQLHIHTRCMISKKHCALHDRCKCIKTALDQQHTPKDTIAGGKPRHRKQRRTVSKSCCPKQEPTFAVSG